MVEGTGELLAASAEGTPVKDCSWEPLNLRNGKTGESAEWSKKRKNMRLKNSGFGRIHI